MGPEPASERKERVLLFLRFCQVLHGWSPVFDAPWELTIQLPAATGVSAQGRTSGLVNIEFVLKGAGDLHMNIMAHFLQECVLYDQMPIWALYPPHEWRGFTAR